MDARSSFVNEPAASLAGRVAVVTGSARGIGAELVTSLAGLGATVVVADLLESGEDVAAGLRVTGGDATFVKTDVSDEASVAGLVEHCRDRYGRLDVLVNNASIYQDLGTKKPFTEISVAEWERVFRVNVTGVWLMSKTAYPLMKERSYGRRRRTHRHLRRRQIDRRPHRRAIRDHREQRVTTPVTNDDHRVTSTTTPPAQPRPGAPSYQPHRHRP